jgi:hypothetical protein
MCKMKMPRISAPRREGRLKASVILTTANITTAMCRNVTDVVLVCGGRGVLKQVRKCPMTLTPLAC